MSVNNIFVRQKQQIGINKIKKLKDWLYDIIFV